MDEQWINFIHHDVDNYINNNTSKQPCITTIHGFFIRFYNKRIPKMISAKNHPINLNLPTRLGDKFGPYHFDLQRDLQND